MPLSQEEFDELVAAPWNIDHLGEEDEALLMTLAHKRPCFMAAYIFPHQVADALKTPEMQLRVVQAMESFDAVQRDYDAFKEDWYEGWDGVEDEPDWPEAYDMLVHLNGMLGDLAPRAVLEAWVIGFSEETIRRDLGKPLEGHVGELHPEFPGYLEVLMALGAEQLSIPERREMVETFIRDHGI